jgi:hypothetical protein
LYFGEDYGVGVARKVFRDVLLDHHWSPLLRGAKLDAKGGGLMAMSNCQREGGRLFSPLLTFILQLHFKRYYGEEEGRLVYCTVVE